MRDPIERIHNPDLCPFCVEKPFYTVHELADLLGYKDHRTIRQLLSKKRFPIRTYIRTISGQPRRVASRYAVERYFNFWAKDNQEKLQDELMKEIIRAEAEAQVAQEEDEADNAAAIKQAIEAQAQRDAEELRGRKLR